ncbi:unannotated protein [freshwater metagenome]|uniref:Unannotated protein n=1 Tax=freshwater metagenome TaxID=449393 RepID=A0A6J6I4X0_9ZZZZ
MDLKEQALEVGRHLDVHARTEGWMHLADCHRSRSEELRQDVVAIRRDDKLRNRRSHSLRAITGEYISEVSCWHRERDWPTRSATKSNRARDVINHLGHDTCPVNGVHRGKIARFSEVLIGEERLDHVLTIIERPLDSDVVHIRCKNCCHLATLNIGHTTSRVKNEHLGCRAIAQCFDSSRTGVARGSPYDRDFFATASEFIVEKSSDKLKRDVFERKRWTVKKLCEPEVVA